MFWWTLDTFSSVSKLYYFDVFQKKARESLQSLVKRLTQEKNLFVIIQFHIVI